MPCGKKHCTTTQNLINSVIIVVPESPSLLIFNHVFFHLSHWGTLQENLLEELESLENYFIPVVFFLVYNVDFDEWPQTSTFFKLNGVTVGHPLVAKLSDRSTE